MRRFFLQLLPVVVLLSIGDVHWLVMQSVTWGQMAAESADADGSVARTLYQSIIGEEKCDRCHQLEADREEDRDGQAQWESKQLLASGCANRELRAFRRAGQRLALSPARQQPHRAEAPLLPPPWA